MFYAVLALLAFWAHGFFQYLRIFSLCPNMFCRKPRATIHEGYGGKNLPKALGQNIKENYSSERKE
jgi:hypothetical protein